MPPYPVSVDSTCAVTVVAGGGGMVSPTAAGAAANGRAHEKPPPPAPRPPPPLDLLFLSYEFAHATFSGNGVLACSQVRALAGRGHRVTVVAGRPEGGEGSGGARAPAAAPANHARLHSVPLPRAAWGWLDGRAAWEAFAGGVAGLAPALPPSAYAAVLAVDWSGWVAAEALVRAWTAATALAAHHPPPPPPPPIIFLNYRVFHHSACTPAGCALSAPVREAEAAAAGGAAATVALCVADAADLAALAARTTASGAAPPAHPAVVLPALRPELASLPPPPPSHSPARTLLLCCVRLAPEKEPGRFAAVVECLAASGALARHGIRPAVVGGGPESDAGAAALRARVVAAAPGALITPGFLAPAALAAVFEATALNFHPPAADAYGMTIVEAGSRGTPSLVAGGGRVGATALLEVGGGVCLADFSAPAADLARRVDALLADRAALAAVGARAAAAARGWDEAAAGVALEEVVAGVLVGGDRGRSPALPGLADGGLGGGART